MCGRVITFPLLYPDVWMNTRVTSGSIRVCVACVRDQGTQIMTGVQAISARLGFRARVHLSQGLKRCAGALHILRPYARPAQAT